MRKKRKRYQNGNKYKCPFCSSRNLERTCEHKYATSKKPLEFNCTHCGREIGPLRGDGRYGKLAFLSKETAAKLVKQ